MSTLFAIALVVICLIGLVTVLSKLPHQGSTLWPVSARPLMNATEWKAYDRLQEALPDHIVLAQVGLSQLVKVRAGKGSRTAENKIFRKVVDFVVIKPDRQVLAVLEVDGPTHQRTSSQRRDADKDAALTAAGYTVHRISAAALPSGAELRTLLYPPPAVPAERREPAL